MRWKIHKSCGFLAYRLSIPTLSIKMSRTFIYNIKPLLGLFCVVKCLLFQQFRKIAKIVCFKKYYESSFFTCSCECIMFEFCAASIYVGKKDMDLFCKIVIFMDHTRSQYLAKKMFIFPKRYPTKQIEWCLGIVL